MTWQSGRSPGVLGFGGGGYVSGPWDGMQRGMPGEHPNVPTSPTGRDFLSAVMDGLSKGGMAALPGGPSILGLASGVKDAFSGGRAASAASELGKTGFAQDQMAPSFGATMPGASDGRSFAGGPALPGFDATTGMAPGQGPLAGIDIQSIIDGINSGVM